MQKKKYTERKNDILALPYGETIYIEKALIDNEIIVVRDV